VVWSEKVTTENSGSRGQQAESARQLIVGALGEIHDGNATTTNIANHPTTFSSSDAETSVALLCDN